MPRRSPLRLADVGAEGVLVAGGGRAILLQLADPAIGHAVARHSDFAADPIRRLRNTLAFVYALVYGTSAQVDAVQRMVNGAHRPVRSTVEEPVAYDAVAPESQLWVAATLYDSAMVLQDRLLGGLDDASRDAVYQDYAVVGTALQMPADSWPADRAAFARYWEGRMPTLSVDDVVLNVAHELLHPRSGPLWLRAGMPLARLVTAGLLPPKLRAAYRMPWSPRRERRYERAMSAIALINRMLPRGIREWPKDYLLRGLDRIH